MTAPVLPVLTGDCARCDGLCCMALAFDAGPKFGCDKAAGVACDHLRADSRCTIHDRLRGAGFSGCVDYDCLGAGQVVCATVLPGVSWRVGAAEKRRVMEAFRALREVHRLIDLVRLAGGLPLDPAQEAARVELLAELVPEDGWSEAALAGFEGGPLPGRVGDFLRGLRDVARSASS
ncbi:hypothetical protein LCL97_23640 [Seohaeicola saemankumensis]|nr:hypothetical protein [Seohaeicola saemankumensis]MCA0873836.1 hypothetical protein [Seohaeicola saemankumensis]